MSLKSLSGAALTAMVLALPALAKTDYPLTIDNCGIELVFPKAPETVVSLGQRGTEILYQLGLADRVRATSVWRSPVLPQFAQVDAGIERLDNNNPSFEAVIERRPDLVTTDLQYYIGIKGSVGTRQQFADLGIPAYNLPSDCADRPQMETSDGPRPVPFEMDLVYRDIAELAEIFDVQDRGAALIADLRKREAAAKAKVGAVSGDVSVVFWFSSATTEADPYVAGQNGAPGYMARQLGMTNIIYSFEDWPTVSWETIARKNPTIIAIADMSRRRYPMDSTEAKMAFLTGDPVASLMEAVSEGRVLPMDAMTLNPSTRIIDGLEALAEAMEAQGLK
ncbi:ABC transporter substrate-binding protein [Sulfitobacter sp. PR48]|uniref:ABC transporter substrate-binding protein n=1 Tax=Sulfitobacter sp. PR48 TaxID=3028383 RepID=UPI00237BFD44|nr:ABC transporter substrate-binding protein [Sulfitobacter sp. PR48]MDD9720537.1 ABC transporter substrate-binding protein [Sulfitobacter sp. PR48]